LKAERALFPSLFTIPCSLFPIPSLFCSLFPIPSLPYSLFPVPCSLFPIPSLPPPNAAGLKAERAARLEEELLAQATQQELRQQLEDVRTSAAEQLLRASEQYEHNKRVLQVRAGARCQRAQARAVVCTRAQLLRASEQYEHSKRVLQVYAAAQWVAT